MHITTSMASILLPSVVLALAACTPTIDNGDSESEATSTSTTQSSTSSETSSTDSTSGGTDSDTADSDSTDSDSTDSDSTDSDSTDSETGSDTDAFIVLGVSGEEIVLDRRWDRGCIGAEGSWSHSERTLTGLELVTTLRDYDNGSETPDCENGAVQITTFTQELTNDQVRLPVLWVDAEGNEAAAPPGLEGVTEQNGASGLLTVATVTPLVPERAEMLNAGEFCGAADWAADVPRDVVDCFTWGVNPGKGTIVVDDTVMPWRVYDGISEDPSEYPVQLPNYAPHEGPFD